MTSERGIIPRMAEQEKIDLVASASGAIVGLGKFYTDALNVERYEREGLSHAVKVLTAEVARVEKEGRAAIAEAAKKLAEAVAERDLARAGLENAKETIARLEEKLKIDVLWLKAARERAIRAFDAVFPDDAGDDTQSTRAAFALAWDKEHWVVTVHEPTRGAAPRIPVSGPEADPEPGGFRPAPDLGPDGVPADETVFGPGNGADF